MRWLLIVLSCTMLLSFVSAVPQVIFSDINITINSNQSGNSTSGVYRILGEGLDASTTFAVNGNCSFSYSRDNIPMTFSRNVNDNDTDLATLIHSLAIFNNMSYQWEECVTNLSICMNDAGYKGNYTQAAAELDVCYRARDEYSKQITDKNAEIDGLTSWRNMGFGAGVIGIAAAAYFYRKQMVKTIPNHYNSIPAVARQY